MRDLLSPIFLALVLATSISTFSPRLCLAGDTLRISPLPPLCELIGEVKAVDCKNNPKIKKLGCDDIEPPPEYWGGLKPFLAMGSCLNRSSGDAVRMRGCMSPIRERYIILDQRGKSENLKLINNQQEFKNFFAPIENKEEALSYVAALTESYPIYTFPKKYFVRMPDENGEYLEKNPRPTEVEEKKDGFVVRLFDHARCGCQRPELYSIDYFVSRGGQIKTGNKKTIWQAHRLYQICID